MSFYNSSTFTGPGTISILVLVLVVVGCQNVPIGPDLPNAERIQPRSSWAAIYPDFIQCVRNLPDTARATHLGEPTGERRAMSVQHLNTKFTDFSWWAVDQTHTGSETENVNELMILIQRPALEHPPKELLKAVVHEMGHRFIGKSYKDGDWGHTHILFHRCSAVELRPA